MERKIVYSYYPTSNSFPDNLMAAIKKAMNEIKANERVVVEVVITEKKPATEDFIFKKEMR